MNTLYYIGLSLGLVGLVCCFEYWNATERPRMFVLTAGCAMLGAAAALILERLL